MKDGFITVRELIAQLQTFPEDAIVFSGGCDCDGESDGAELIAGDCAYDASSRWARPYVLIRRAPGR